MVSQNFLSCNKSTEFCIKKYILNVSLNGNLILIFRWIPEKQPMAETNGTR